MERKATSDTIVGLFVLAGLVALLAVTFVIRQDYFRSTMHVSATFESVSGLEIGAPVLVNGISGGRVARIEFKEGVEPTYPSQALVYEPSMAGEVERPVVVRVIVPKKIPIYSNARVRLAQQGFIGDRRVEIDPGQPGPGITQVIEGDVLLGAPSFDMEKVFAEARAVVEEVQGAVRGIREIVTDDETLAEMRETLANINVTTRKVNDYLVANEADVRSTVEEARALVASARRVSEQAEQHFGPDGEVTLMVAEGREAISSLRAKAETTMARGGEAIDGIDANAARVADSAVELLDVTKANQQQVLADLRATREHLDEILVRLRRGEGTIGRLLIDPAPFEDLKDSINALHAFFVGREARFYEAGVPYILPKPEPAPAPAGAPSP